MVTGIFNRFSCLAPERQTLGAYVVVVTQSPSAFPYTFVSILKENTMV